MQSLNETDSGGNDLEPRAGSSVKRKRAIEECGDRDENEADHQEAAESVRADDGEEDATGSHPHQKAGSQDMEMNIQQIREKLERFTLQVSGLLEAGKTYFVEAANTFEERIVQLHQKQMETWEQEIELLRTMDSFNEDIGFRLTDARVAIDFVIRSP